MQARHDRNPSGTASRGRWPLGTKKRATHARRHMPMLREPHTLRSNLYHNTESASMTDHVVDSRFRAAGFGQKPTYRWSNCLPSSSHSQIRLRACSCSPHLPVRVQATVGTTTRSQLTQINIGLFIAIYVACHIGAICNTVMNAFSDLMWRRLKFKSVLSLLSKLFVRTRVGGPDALQISAAPRSRQRLDRHN